MHTDRRLTIARVVFAAAASGLIAGCAAERVHPYMGEPGRDNFGEANRQTYAAQVIDPAPVYDYAVPETSGEHAAQAVERYRKDKVKLPDKTTTTQPVTGSGGGG